MSVLAIKNGIRDFFYGCQGLEKLAFPIMRKQLSLLYSLTPQFNSDENETSQQSVRLKVYENKIVRSAVERFTLTVHASCSMFPHPIVDGVLVFGRSDAPIQNLCTNGSHVSVEELPIVLYCPPNAGFYECIGMSPVHSTWVGVYSQLLGLDVCVFNYRYLWLFDCCVRVNVSFHYGRN